MALTHERYVLTNAIAICFMKEKIFKFPLLFDDPTTFKISLKKHKIRERMLFSYYDL
jgi:hypothetical protein